MKYSFNQTAAALTELQTTLHWALTMIKAPSAIGAMPENVIIRCTSAAPPEVESADFPQADIQGHSLKFVGKTTKTGSIQLQFYEGTDAAVTNYWLSYEKAKWAGDGSDTTGVQNLTETLKFDLRLELMGPNDVVTQTYDLIHCLGAYTHGIQLGQTADPVQPTLQVDFDDYHVHTGSVDW